MYRLKTTANFNTGGGGTVEEVIHDSTLIGKGTSESPLKVDQSKFAKPTDLNDKQDTLISGTNIKTINNQSILGNGNINIEGGSGGTSELSTEVKNAILDCFENVAWATASGQEYYDALSHLFFPPVPLVSISAVFNQGQNVIYDDATLDSLKQYLNVTALYEDDSTETVTNYSLSGTLSVGTSTITVAYQSKTTTFNVNVTARPTVTGIEATYTQGSTVVYDDASLDTLKANLVVKLVYSDSSKVTLDSNDYTLSGTLSEGTSTITVTYSTFTATFTVTVTARAELSSISAVFTQGDNVFYENSSLNDLKPYLVVTANYSDSSTETITNYTLSGTLTAGTSTITVSYGGKTTTFTVTVTAVVVTSIDAVFTQGSATITTNNSLDDLKQYLTVTANYNNGTTSTVSDYVLSGTLEVGISTITVTYGNLTDTFTVTVTPPWDFEWYATTSNKTLPVNMTAYDTPIWGVNDEYVRVEDPRFPGDTSLIGDMILEIEAKWAKQSGYSANAVFCVSSAEKTGVKIFLVNNSGNINIYSASTNGGSGSAKTVGTGWSAFHTYRFELVGTLCKTYIDGQLVDTGYTYYSQWNGYPIIWSEEQVGRTTLDIKSIKYRKI